MKRNAARPTVLFVSEDDVLKQAVQAAARGLRSMNAMVALAGAAELMAYLDRCNASFYDRQNPCPDLILFDLNVARNGATDVLARLKNDGVFRSIPVVVLAHEPEGNGHVDLYDLGVNAFVVYSGDPVQMEATLRAIERFWLDVATLPHTERALKRR